MFTSEDIKYLDNFQEEGWENIKTFYDFYIHSDHCFPLKLRKNNEIIAIGTIILHYDVAWLAHIIVHEGHRLNGWGTVITQKLMEIADKNLIPTIYSIATDSGNKLYKKVGFTDETKYLFFEDISLKEDFSISNKILQYKKEFKEAVSDLDFYVSKESRMPFLERFLEGSYIYCNENEVEGLYIPSLEEGMIIGKTKTAGIELLKLHLNIKKDLSKNISNDDYLFGEDMVLSNLLQENLLKGIIDTNMKVVMPQNNQNGKNFLENQGFKVTNTGTRMRFGVKRNVKLNKIFNRIGGNLG